MIKQSCGIMRFITLLFFAAVLFPGCLFSSSGGRHSSGTVTADHNKARYHTVLHSLPFHHSDPFDRLILVQSMAEGIELLHTVPVFDSCRMISPVSLLQ